MRGVSMELQLWLRLLVVGSLAADTNSATSSSATSSTTTCPYDPTLAGTWLRAHSYSGGSRAELQLGKARAHSYSWGRLTQCPQASWVERYTQLVKARGKFWCPRMHVRTAVRYRMRAARRSR